MTLADITDQFTTGVEELKDAIFDAQDSLVKLQTLHNVVELSILRGCSLLERFLEELFYITMLQPVEHGGPGPVMAVTNPSEVDLLVYSAGTRKEKYLDWLPFQYALERAETFLIGGEPFSRLKYRSVERRALEELVTIRNAIAHPSDYAGRKFRELAQQKKYPAARPGEYLLSVRSGQPEVLLLLTRIEITAKGLVAADPTAANAVLEPESPFFPQQRCPPGAYRCEGCAAERTLSSEAVIGACSMCSIFSECDACGRRSSASTNWRRIFSNE